jgi:hypothetical protein
MIFNHSLRVVVNPLRSIKILGDFQQLVIIWILVKTIKRLILKNKWIVWLVLQWKHWIVSNKLKRII